MAKIIKSYVSVFMCVLILLSSLMIGAVSASASYEQTRKPDLTIKTLSELKDFSAKVNGTGKYWLNPSNFAGKLVVLDADIDGFDTPIGTFLYPFCGTFDGNGHTVGLKMDNVSDNYAGLFGSIDNKGYIKNVVVSGVVKGNDFAGGIVGYADNGGKIENCYNLADIKGELHVGGIVGHNTRGCVVVNCGNAGKVESSMYAGGICGYNTRSSSILNCYNFGSVTGNLDGGGICGRNTRNAVIKNCASYGKVKYSLYGGGVCGISNLDAVVENSYFNKDNAGVKRAVGDESDKPTVKGLSEEECKSKNGLAKLLNDYIVAQKQEEFWKRWNSVEGNYPSFSLDNKIIVEDIWGYIKGMYVNEEDSSKIVKFDKYYDNDFAVGEYDDYYLSRCYDISDFEVEQDINHYVISGKNDLGENVTYVFDITDGEVTSVTYHDDKVGEIKYNKKSEPKGEQIKDSNTYWYVEDGILHINGFGPMPDFENSKDTAWASVKDSIKGVVVEEWVTKIGKNAFGDLDNVESVVIAPSVKSIEMYAFNWCSNLKEVTFMGKPDNINSTAFTGVHATVNVPKTWLDGGVTLEDLNRPISQRGEYQYGGQLKYVISDVMTYTVTFDVNGHGTAPESVEVVEGSLVQEPQAPTDENYTFKGWFKEQTCENEWNFDVDVVNENTTIYAMWISNLDIAKAYSINEIDEYIEGETSEKVIAVADEYKKKIEDATTIEEVNKAREEAIEAIDWQREIDKNGMPGDVNLDKKVNLLDVRTLISVILNGKTSSLQKIAQYNADVDYNGQINVADARLITVAIAENDFSILEKKVK